MRYTIIGNSAAGVKAAETIRKLEPDSIITILSDEQDIAYSRCLISWYVDGSLQKERLYFRTENFYKDYNIEALLAHKVIKIDRINSKVICENGKEVEYDKLLIAMGSTPACPPIGCVEYKGVYNFHTLSDAQEILDNLKNVKHAVIVGAGFIGLEAAYSLARRNIEVTIVERLPQLLPNSFDVEASQIFLNNLKDSNIKLITGISLESITGENKTVSSVNLANGTKIECQMVIIAIGVIPNLNLAKEADLNVAGGIIVDEYLKTNDPKIFAAGDVIEINDITSGKRVPSATWYNATVQGKYAAYNMVGKERRYTNTVGNQSAVEFREVPAISFGNYKGDVDGDCDAITVRGGNIYRKLVIKDDYIVGLIFVGDITNAGFYAKLIKIQFNIRDVRKKLLDPDFSYAFFKSLDFEELSPYS